MRLPTTGAVISANSMINTPGEDIHLFNRNCRRRVVTFTEDHVEVNGEKISFWDPDAGSSAKKYKKLTPEIVNSVVASEMAICWFMNLEGKSYMMDEVDINNNDPVCLPCAEIRFASTLSSAYTDAEQSLIGDFLKKVIDPEAVAKPIQEIQEAVQPKLALATPGAFEKGTVEAYSVGAQAQYQALLRQEEKALKEAQEANAHLSAIALNTRNMAANQVETVGMNTWP